MPELSVVIASVAADPSPAIDSVRVAAAHADIDIEFIVLSDRPIHAVDARNGSVVEVFPLGGAYARNRGLALASAPIVAFLDAQLVVGPYWAEALLEELARRPDVDAVVGPVSGHTASGGRAKVFRRLRLELLPPAWMMGGVSNASFRRSKLLDVGGFEHVISDRPDASAAASAEILIRLARRGGRIAWAPTMLAATTANRSRESVDSAPAVGRIALRRRYPALAVTYAATSAGGERLRAVRGLVSGTRHEPDSAGARALLDLMPSSLRDELVAPPDPLARSYRAKTHFIYRAGPDRILHLHVNPSDRLRRSLAEREAIRLRSAVEGIPRLRARFDANDAVWVLEDALPGRPPAAKAHGSWFGKVAEWAVGMAGPPGRVLGTVATWTDHCAEVLSHTPPGLRARVGSALERVSHLPAVHMHGDLQRRNVLMDRDRVGAVDWEGAWLEGLPGLDLVYLALFAASDTPDDQVLERLAHSGDAPAGLREGLRRLGVDESVLHAALLAMLGTWALSEDRRLTRLGSPPGKSVFRPLFHRLARS